MDKDFDIVDGKYVFTAEYHLRRGTCCGNGCINCPYDYESVFEPKRTELLNKRIMKPFSDKAIKVANYTFDTFNELVEQLRTEFKSPFDFTISRTNECSYSIYINGNKKAGFDYDMNMWKEVPVIGFDVRHYSAMHPTMPGEEFVDLRMVFANGHGSEDGDFKNIDNGVIN